MSIYTLEVCDVCGKEWKVRGIWSGTGGTFHTNFSRNIDVYFNRGEDGDIVAELVEGITSYGKNTEWEANEIIECLEKSGRCDLSVFEEVKASVIKYYKNKGSSF